MSELRKFNLYCSFCRKGANAVKKLIAGPGVFICNVCVGLCVKIIEGPAEEAPAEGGQQRSLEELQHDAEAQIAANLKKLDSTVLLSGLVAVEQGVELSRQVLQAQIDVLREREVSWAQIGNALGISRQAAWERFG